MTRAVIEPVVTLGVGWMTLCDVVPLPSSLRPWRAIQ